MDKLRGNSYIVNYDDHRVIEHENEIKWDILIRMELLTPLNDILQRKPLSEEEVIQLGIDICKALELCNQYQIIHRDVKPENIFLSKSGTYKLGDFGIARVAEKTTGASTRVGTGSYMAPEIYRGERYNSSVDTYALGIVLYRLMNNGRLPFLPQPPNPITHMAREEAQMKRMSGQPFPLPAQASVDFARVICKAASFTPSDRYYTAKEMREALETLLVERIKADSLPANLEQTENEVEKIVVATLDGKQDEIEVEMTESVFEQKKPSVIVERGSWSQGKTTALLAGLLLVMVFGVVMVFLINDIQKEGREASELASMTVSNNTMDSEESLTDTPDTTVSSIVKEHDFITLKRRLPVFEDYLSEIAIGSFPPGTELFVYETMVDNDTTWCKVLYKESFGFVNILSEDDVEVASEKNSGNEEDNTSIDEARELFENGLNYYYGMDVEIDYEKAYDYLLKASESPLHSYSFFLLGRMYQEGQGVEKDENTAIYYYEQAAERGVSDAVLQLGSLYYEGIHFSRREQTGLWLMCLGTVDGSYGANEYFKEIIDARSENRPSYRELDTRDYGSIMIDLQQNQFDLKSGPGESYNLVAKVTLEDNVANEGDYKVKAIALDNKGALWYKIDLDNNGEVLTTGYVRGDLCTYLVNGEIAPNEAVIQMVEAGAGSPIRQKTLLEINASDEYSVNVRCKNASTRMRREASVDSEIVAEIDAETSMAPLGIVIDEKHQLWFLVRYDDIFGYVLGDSCYWEWHRFLRTVKEI